MIAALIALLLTWVVLHFIEHQSLEALGFRPTPRRLKLAARGILLTAAFLVIYYLLETVAWHTYYRLNLGFSTSWLLTSLWTILVSALFEELVFRGALLYILIKRIGRTKAVLISAVAFGVYHWFLVGIHSIPQMTLLFFSMAWTGYVFAEAFAVTGSILIPLALHFASNFIGACILGDDRQLFSHAPGMRPSAIVLLLLVAIHNFVYPLIVLGWVQYVKKRKL